MRRHSNGERRILSPAEAEEIAAELTEAELDAGRLETLCAKWATDGARALSEAADQIHDFAEWLRELECDGWQLVEPTDGGHAVIVNRDPEKRLEEPE